jgi:hypothetical protein
MRVEKCKRNLRPNATHIEQCGEEALLIAARKSNERLLIFTNDVMQVELNVHTFTERGEKARENPNSESESATNNDHRIVLSPTHTPGGEGVHD